MLVQKNDADLKTIRDYIIMIWAIKLIFTQVGMIKLNKIGPYHACNGTYLVKDCDAVTCLRYKPNPKNHTPSKCARRCHTKRQLSHNTFNNSNIVNGHKNHYTKPTLQLSVLTNKPDQMVALLEATWKMIKYSKCHLNIHHHTLITLTIIKVKQAHLSQTNINATCHYHKEEVNKITSNIYTPYHIATETNNIPDNSNVDSSGSTMDSASDSEWLSQEHEIIKVKLRDTKYAVKLSS